MTKKIGKIVAEKMGETEQMPIDMKDEQLSKKCPLKLSFEQRENLVLLLEKHFIQIQPPFTQNDLILYPFYRSRLGGRTLNRSKEFNLKLQPFEVGALVAVLNDFGVEILQQSDLRTVRDGLVQHQSNLLS